MSWWALTLAHLRLVLLALAVALVIGLGTGLSSSRRPRLARAMLALSAWIQTVPAIALLAVMVPALAGIASLTGLRIASIGELPALIALVMYALLPLVRGVLVGLGSVDPNVSLAARAVGMTPRQRWMEVELPLAAPSILGGLRTAAVWTVGMATLATPVGARSLGNLIFAGLQTRQFDQVLEGCAAAAGLALILDGAFALMEHRARGRYAMRSLRAVVLGVVLAATLAGLAPLVIERDRGAPIRIGAKSFTEQLILAEVLRCAIATDAAGIEVRPSLGTTVAFDALRAGDLDTYVEYTGTAWTTLLGRDAPIEREQMLEEVTDVLERDYHVHVVARLGFENAYAVVVRDDDPATSIDVLANRSSMRFGADYEFFARDEWARLVERYGLTYVEQITMDPSLLYEALHAGEIDAIAGYTTDGRIDSLSLRVLADTRGALPPYDAIVLVSSAFFDTNPGAVARLRALEATIDAPRMRRWNGLVDSGTRTPASAASEHAACR
jgi:osmoprotectant transport system permease protein